MSFEWNKFGFKLHFPENALEANDCCVEVKASFSGQFLFPEGTELISGVYWITCSHKFVKPVTVEIQHCAAKPEYSSSLTFIYAKCNQEDLPYQFKKLTGGVFSPNSQYGSIKLKHFSGLGVAYHCRSLMQGPVSRTHQPRSYCLQLYYSSTNTHCWEFCFTITWNLKLHIQVSVQCFIDSVFLRLGLLKILYHTKQVYLYQNIFCLFLPTVLKA